MNNIISIWNSILLEIISFVTLIKNFPVKYCFISNYPDFSFQQLPILDQQKRDVSGYPYIGDSSQTHSFRFFGRNLHFSSVCFIFTIIFLLWTKPFEMIMILPAITDIIFDKRTTLFLQIVLKFVISVLSLTFQMLISIFNFTSVWIQTV